MTGRRRVYLATDPTGLRALRDDGVLPARSYEPFFAAAADEEAEYDAMRTAAGRARERHGRILVVAADVDFDAGDPPVGVGLDAIASFHVGEDLSWYAVQELRSLL